MPARGSLRPKDNYETPRIKDVEGDAKRRLPATSTSQLPLPAQFPTTTCVGVSSGEATPHSASRPHTAAHFSSHIELYSCCGCPRADWHPARSDRRACPARATRDPARTQSRDPPAPPTQISLRPTTAPNDLSPPAQIARGAEPHTARPAPPRPQPTTPAPL